MTGTSVTSRNEILVAVSRGQHHAGRVEFGGFHDLAAPAEATDRQCALVYVIEAERVLQFDLVDGAGDEGAKPCFGGGKVQRLRQVPASSAITR